MVYKKTIIPKKQVLFISNGTGEDLNASLILQSLIKIAPKTNIVAMALVGSGNAYQRLGISLIGPRQTLPSGGIFYTHFLNLVKDISSGLVGLTLRQIKSLLNYRQHCSFCVAVGDVFPVVMAYLTNRPFVAFLVSTSSYYEGRLRLPKLTLWCLQSHRCLAVFTRDAFTAEDLQQQGMTKATFAGYPILDVLSPTDNNLNLNPKIPTIALLPGSRLPEALHNLTLQLKVCEAISELEIVQFRVPLVSDVMEKDLKTIAKNQGWQYQSPGIFSKTKQDKTIIVECYWNAFADILQRCDLVLGMAGTAVEQAVGLGKPIVQLPGYGPQFTYSFADAQMRLLGISVKTVGTTPNNPTLFTDAAHTIQSILKNPQYLEACLENGRRRVGQKGGSDSLAYAIAQLL
ncbi:lipid-A-disaccharide synthase-related protein [Cyanobacterium sp. uoEpiScrs1]|uniref:lipid-A-disaccharide synthase-related protein n=1 Tax=Cyanobacterium sp. uoEpiScrs1 TaxID=2976343 RepID=UPI00226983DA|nr:lipid-A-disaccharide synthase-related protein [Cyanobacterium sp. uoEpiScrs1]